MSERSGNRGLGRGALIGATGMLLVVLAYSALRGSPETPVTAAGAASDAAAPAEEIVARVGEATRQELTVAVSATGTVTAKRSVAVSAEVGGRALAVEFQRGDAVVVGQLLVVIEDDHIRTQLEEASSVITPQQVELAKKEWDRNRLLLEEGLVSETAVDRAHVYYLGQDAIYKSSQAKVRQFQQQLVKTKVRSPIEGIVTTRDVEVGEYVAPGERVATVEDMKLVLVDAEVPDRDVIRIREGLPVEVRSDAYPGKVFEGTVLRVSSSAETATRNFRIEAQVENPALELRSGMIARLRILLERDEGLTVPADALFQVIGDRALVYRVTDGVAREVEVRTGRRDGDLVEILGGLDEGDTVVTYGVAAVRDGQRVRSFSE